MHMHAGVTQGVTMHSQSSKRKRNFDRRPSCPNHEFLGVHMHAQSWFCNDVCLMCCWPWSDDVDYHGYALHEEKRYKHVTNACNLTPEPYMS